MMKFWTSIPATDRRYGKPGEVVSDGRAYDRSVIHSSKWDAALYDRIRSLLFAKLPDLSAALEAVRPIPSLVLVGANDRTITLNKSFEVAQKLGCKFKALKDCANAPQEELPSEFVQLFSTWLDKTL